MKSASFGPVILIMCALCLVEGMAKHKHLPKSRAHINQPYNSLQKTIYGLFQQIQKKVSSLQNTVIQSVSQIQPAINKFANGVREYAIGESKLSNLPTAAKLRDKVLRMLPTSQWLFAEPRKAAEEAKSIAKKETKSAYRDTMSILRSALFK